VKTRKLPRGDRNIVGARVTEARLALGMKQNELLAKLQTAGIEISTPALSLLEVNIPASGDRLPGEMGIANPSFRESSFRNIGNHCPQQSGGVKPSIRQFGNRRSDALETIVPENWEPLPAWVLPGAEQRPQ